jgi:hypothetical protein
MFPAMSNEHDASRQLDGLQQCLSQTRRPLGLFLAAGCGLSIPHPADEKRPLIRDIAGLTEDLATSLKDSPNPNVYQSVVAHLIEDGVAKPNIEVILSHVRAMSRMAGKKELYGHKRDAIDKLEIAICEFISKSVDQILPEKGTPYHHLGRWLRSHAREEPVEIFTTNYDLLIEQGLEAQRAPFFDGFIGNRQPFLDIAAIEQDQLPARWTRLWKLHGSINWQFEQGAGLIRRVGGAAGGSALIHPSHLKYEQSRRMPYLIMIDRLRSFLRKPSAVLVVSGYSFGDDHINECLVEGLRSNPSAVVFGLLFGQLDGYTHAHEFATTASNLKLLARDAAIVGARKGAWKKTPDGKIVEFDHGNFAIFGTLLGDLAGAEQAPA